MKKEDIIYWSKAILLIVVISTVLILVKVKLQNDYDNMTPEEQSKALTSEKAANYYYKNRFIFFK